MTKADQLKTNKPKNPNEHIDSDKIKWIKSLACFVCGSVGNVEAHHTIIKGMGGRNKRNDRYLLPLCPTHHRGEFSPHGRDSDKFYQEFPKQFIKLKAEEYHTRYQDD